MESLRRFGVFEVDTRTGELRKRGVRVPLQQQPFRVLIRLLERPGEVVTREELHDQLWPADTYVDFDQGINGAVKRLREALGDSAETPRFIETLPRRGYRFIAPLQQPSFAALDHASHETPQQTQESGVLRKRTVATAVSALAAISGTGLAAFWLSAHGGPPAVREPSLVPLTSNPQEMTVTSARISPDGRHVAFADANGLHVQSLDSGELHRFVDTKDMNVYGWTADSTGVLASQCDAVNCTGWIVSLIGQDRRRSAAVWRAGEQVRVAPDGQRLLRLAFTDGRGSVSVDPMNGEPARRVATGDVVRANWSADGQRILVVAQPQSVIESIPLAGGPSVQLFRPEANQLIFDVLELPDHSLLVAMMPPGAAQVSTPQVDIWKIRPRQRGMADESPRRLTWTATAAADLSASATGDRVVFITTRFQRDVYMADADLKSGVLGTPRRFTLSEADDGPFTWTADGGALFITSNRGGTSDIFRQRIDSDIADPFLTGPGSEGYPEATADGRWVLYTDGTYTDKRVMRVPSAGGTPTPLIANIGARAQLRCAVRGRCVLREVSDGSMVISSVDPVAGKGRELARIPLGSSGFDLTPNGDAVAYVLPQADGTPNRVRFVSFDGKTRDDIAVPAAPRLQDIQWLPSNSGFLTADHGKVLLVPVSGVPKVLWAPTVVSAGWAVASPDERHVAISAWSAPRNAWMLSGF